MKSYWRLAIAMFIGIVLGAAALHLYHRDRPRSQAGPDEWFFIDCTRRLIEDVDTLMKIRQGDTNYVIDALERDLSSQVHHLVRDLPEKALSDKSSIRILKAAARYRSAHPFKTGDADTDRFVDDALARIQNDK